jgi:hypothetical protein
MIFKKINLIFILSCFLSLPLLVSATPRSADVDFEQWYSTYFGGGDEDWCSSIVVDDDGNMYVTGSASPGFPTTTGVYNESHNGADDAFVAKFDSSGDLVFSTLFGGSGLEYPMCIDVDSSDNIYIVGTTSSADFPTTPGVIDETPSGAGFDGFITKINSDGTDILYSTVIGTSYTIIFSCSVDMVGNIYLTGITNTNYPTTSGAYDESFNGGSTDTFISKLNPTATSLVYSTFVGGDGDDEGRSIVVDDSGYVFVTGGATEGTVIDFPTTSGVINETHNGNQDVFVLKMNQDGSDLEYSTLLGGTDTDGGLSIFVDSSGNAYFTGHSDANFPTTPNVFDNSGTWDNSTTGGFISKINPNATLLMSSMVLDVAGELDSIVVDSSDNIYVVGWSLAEPLPITASGNAHSGNEDIWIGKFNPTLTQILYGSYYGGNADEHTGALIIGDRTMILTVGTDDQLYACGITLSADFPISSDAYQSSNAGGGGDGFIIRFGQISDDEPLNIQQEGEDKYPWLPWILDSDGEIVISTETVIVIVALTGAGTTGIILLLRVGKISKTGRKRVIRK